MIERGRVCVKTAGREAGRKCVILEILDDNFVVVWGPKVKKRRCNIDHLEPTPVKLEIREETEEALKKAFEEAGLI